jgi:hypothetical protein
LRLLQERARDSRVDEDRGRDQHHRQVGADLVRRGCAVTGVTYTCYNAGGTSGLREHNAGLRCRRTGSVTQLPNAEHLIDDQNSDQYDEDPPTVSVVKGRATTTVETSHQ